MSKRSEEGSHTMAEKRLEIGLCMPPPGAALAERMVEAGCEYYEPTVARALMEHSAEAFDASLDAWSEGGLSPRSANVLLPGDLKVVGEAVDTDRLQQYFAEAMRRANALGIERVVFGSGGAREVPEGFSRERAEHQLRDVAVMVAESAGDIIICLEHLRRAETNILNSLAESGAMAAALNRPNIKLVVDGYHLAEEHEDVGVVKQVADYIAHVHVCGPARRPPSAEDHAALTALFSQLADIGYRGRCSIECHFEDLEAEAPAALAAVRHAAEVTGLR